MENNFELLPLTDDYIFKRVFAYKGNESVLKDFLEALLKIEIKGIKITNPEIIPYEKGEKRGLLDIKAEINDGTMLDVEMQMKNERNTEERATEYMGKMISEQLQVGEDYQNLKKSIVIFITNYNFLKRNSYHSVGKMKFDKTILNKVMILPLGLVILFIVYRTLVFSVIMNCIPIMQEHYIIAETIRNCIDIMTIVVLMFILK